MANTWFQFKQFTIHQDQCAMKVTTDACLFGAWVATDCSLHHSSGKALDVGAGTGLLSLMCAQQNKALTFEAIEIDENAAVQAAHNAEQSPFAAQMEIKHCDFSQASWSEKFPVILSNPPYHEQQLASTKHAKNLAHHDAGLTLEVLFAKCSQYLEQEGFLYLLIPYYRETDALAMAATVGLEPSLICRVQQSWKHPFFRSMIRFSKAPGSNPTEITITIVGENGSYTEAFTSLLQPYYLKL